VSDAGPTCRPHMRRSMVFLKTVWGKGEKRRRRTGDEAGTVADEACPDDAGVDAVSRHVRAHLL
jgi:hypothetical protein